MKKIIAVLLFIALLLSCVYVHADATYGVWSVRQYVDDFQEPTGIKYAVNTYYIEGTFTNSATSGSTSYMEILVDYEDTALVLYEYGTWNKVKNNTSQDHNYTIKVKSGSNNATFTGHMYSGGGERIFIEDPMYFDALLANSSTVSIYIETTLYGSLKNTYLFNNFSTTGFSSAAADAYGKKPTINVSFNMDEGAIGTPLAATYTTKNGHPETRSIYYIVQVFDGADVLTVQEGYLNSPSGTFSYTPTYGIGMYITISVYDSVKLNEIYSEYIPLDSVYLDLPKNTTEIESGAFANVGRVVIVEVPDKIEHIAEDAFTGAEYVLLYGNNNSVARSYVENKAKYFYYDNE